MQERQLKDLLESQFAEGYEQFREYVDFSEGSSGFTDKQKAALRLYELLSVAMVQGLNEVETKYSLPPEVTMPLLWQSIGNSVATMNGQAFQKADGKIKKIAFQNMDRAYKAFLKISAK